MNHEAVLAVLPNTESDAKSLKEIAEALGIDIIKYADWIRVSRNLARVLRILIKRGWVATLAGNEWMAISSGIMSIGRPN